MNTLPPPFAAIKIVLSQRAQNTTVIVPLHILPIMLAIHHTAIAMLNTGPPLIIIRIIRNPNHIIPGPGIAVIVQTSLAQKSAIRVVVSCVLREPFTIFCIDKGCCIIKADNLDIPQPINRIADKITQRNVNIFIGCRSCD